MALMQNAFKHQAHMLKTRMQQGKMKLHAKPSKFHIEHAPNGATVNTYTRNKFKRQAPKIATRNLTSIITTCYKNKIGTNMICT